MVRITPIYEPKKRHLEGVPQPQDLGTFAKQPLLSTTCINESWDDPTLQVSADPAERWDTKRLNDFQTFNHLCENKDIPWKLMLEDESSF